MEVKGTAIKSIPDFVRAKHNSEYPNFIKSLPVGSRDILRDVIITNHWYPLKESLIDPIIAIGNLFYKTPNEAAWTMGRYSASVALKGIYALYVKIGTPSHLIERASKVFAAYFQPSELHVASSSKGELNVHITKFQGIHEVVEYNIAGWMQHALEISGCKEVSIDISRSMTKGHPYTEFRIRWHI